MLIQFGRSCCLSPEVRKVVLAAFFSLALNLSVTAQSPAPDSSVLLSRASQAFTAGKPVTSVEMSGRAEWTAGSTKDNGLAKLIANINGENKAEFDMSKGTRIESQSAFAKDRTCTWSGKDGVTHDVASSNCWTAAIWFLPHLAIQGAGLPPALNVQSVDGNHIRHQVTFPDSADPSSSRSKAYALIQEWSRTDLTLDSETALPSSLKYMIHPDNNSSVNIQVEVRYSNYQKVSDVELPMHIERYVNGALQLSIDITSAIIN